MLKVGDSQCQPAKIDNSTWSFTTDFKSCGTKMSSNADAIKFSNSFSLESRSDSIVMFPEPEITFTCTFPVTVNVNSNGIAFVPEPIHKASGAASEGEFVFDLNYIAKDGNGNQLLCRSYTASFCLRYYYQRQISIVRIDQFGPMKVNHPSAGRDLNNVDRKEQ